MMTQHRESAGGGEALREDTKELIRYPLQTDGWTMKYLCLGYLNIKAFDGEPEEVKSAILKKCFAQCEPFRATGKVIEEEGLQSPETAKCIRPKNGKPIVADGPFIETKEQLGSFFIVEANNIDEAVAIASLHPAALFGEQYGFGIEVRPIQA
jgi:hypothetical protein